MTSVAMNLCEGTVGQDGMKLICGTTVAAKKARLVKGVKVSYGISFAADFNLSLCVLPVDTRTA